VLQRDLYPVEYNILLSVGRSQCFRGTCRFQLQGLRISQTRNQHEACNKQSFAAFWFLALLICYPKDGGDIPPNFRWAASGLHGVIPQKIELFITTAMRTSNSIQVLCED
jgi:hypothetical protein